MRYTIQISNHPDAGSRPATAAAAASWSTVFDGRMAADNIRMIFAQLADLYVHVRAFRGQTLGKLFLSTKK